ncbi:MAG: hypothetical protein IT460_15210 [Planctomycetes bacterium]|nr:hypothetical protein [Planctomycetota bacterium]
MAAASGNGPTLLVTVGAETGALSRGMAQGEQVVRRFRRTVEMESEAVGRANDRMASGFRMSSEKIGRSIGTAVGGLAMLAGTAEGVANTVGGSLTRSFGAFLTAGGGPQGALAAGITLVADGIGFLGRRSREAADAADRLREANARAAAEAAKAAAKRKADHDAYLAGLQTELDLIQRGVELRSDRREAGQSARVRAALDADFAAGASLKGTTAASKARELNRAEDAASRARAFGDQMKADAEAANERAEAARRLGEAEADRRVALRRQLDDLVAQSKATEQQRAHWSEIQRIAEMRRLGMRLEADLAQKMLADTMSRENAEKNLAAAQREEAEFARRVAENRAAMEKEIEEAKKRQLAIAEQAARVAAREREEAEAAHARRFEAAQAEAAAAKSVRAALDSQYAGGMGPMAAERAAKKAARNVERFRRHEANMSAEARARASWGYGTNIRPDGTGWGDGAAGGVDPTGGMSLDDWFRDRQSKSKPTYPNLPPGLLMPPIPGADGQGFDFGKAFGGAGANGNPSAFPPVTTPSNPEPVDRRSMDVLGDAAGKLGAAGDKAKEAGDAITGASEEMKSAAGEITDGADRTSKAAADVATNVAAIGTGVLTMAEAIESVSDELATLKQQLATAGYIAA